jgi:hypothetical protein
MADTDVVTGAYRCIDTDKADRPKEKHQRNGKYFRQATLMMLGFLCHLGSQPICFFSGAPEQRRYIRAATGNHAFQPLCKAAEHLPLKHTLIREALENTLIILNNVLLVKG